VKLYLKVYFSRHAKRRSKLYNIPEETIREILLNKGLQQGRQEFVEVVNGFYYPIKIVVKVEDELVTVITNYPFKKGGRARR